MTKLYRERWPRQIARMLYAFACNILIALALFIPRYRGRASVFYAGAVSGSYGGARVKVSRLSASYPQKLLSFNTVYSLSNMAFLSTAVLRLMRLRKIPVIHNQNGVYHPGWYSGNYQKKNRLMARVYADADYVFYQSRFCKRCAEEYLGPTRALGEVLYNAVDTTHFSPDESFLYGKREPYIFLLAGKIDIHLFYRISSTVEGYLHASHAGLNCRLHIAGVLSEGVIRETKKLIDQNQLEGSVILKGPYSQAEAPSIYQSAHAYIMTKENDPCPNTVIEAMACGLPIVYAKSGGVPELVGEEAGVGLDVGGTWLKPGKLDAAGLGNAMLQVARDHERYAREARARAVRKFNLDYWMSRHKNVFDAMGSRG